MDKKFKVLLGATAIIFSSILSAAIIRGIMISINRYFVVSIFVLTPAFANATTIDFDINSGYIGSGTTFITGPFSGLFTAELEAGTNNFLFDNPTITVDLISGGGSQGALSMTIVNGILSNTQFGAAANPIGFEGFWTGEIEYTSPYGDGTISSIPSAPVMLFIDFDGSFTLPGPSSFFPSEEEFFQVNGVTQLTTSGGGTTPEPSVITLLGAGLVGLGFVRRRKHKA